MCCTLSYDDLGQSIVVVHLVGETDSSIIFNMFFGCIGNDGFTPCTLRLNAVRSRYCRIYVIPNVLRPFLAMETSATSLIANSEGHYWMAR